MDTFRVTAGYVTVETELPGGSRANIDVPKGEFLPADVPQAQIDWELQLNTIERIRPAAPERVAAPEVPKPVEPVEANSDELPPGLSVSATLTWVNGSESRALIALLAEQASASPRATLLDRLAKIIDAGAKPAE